MINTIKKRSAKELYEIFLSDYKKFNYIFKHHTIAGLNDEEDEDLDDDDEEEDDDSTERSSCGSCCSTGSCGFNEEEEYSSDENDDELNSMSKEDEAEEGEFDCDPSEYALQFFAIRMIICAHANLMLAAHNGSSFQERRFSDEEITANLRRKKIILSDSEEEVIGLLNLVYIELISLSNFENLESGVYTNDSNMDLNFPVEFLHKSIEILYQVMQRIQL